MPGEGVVSFRPRAVLTVVAVLLGVGVVLWIIYVAHQVLSWMLISLFLALAINPAVERVLRLGIRRRGAAAGVVFFGFVAVVAAVAALFVPTVVNQVSDFVNAIPGYVHDLTHGRGRLGFLETRYHVVERVQEAIKNRQGGGLLGNGAGTVISVTKGIITGVVATVTIIFMTLFMLLEGPAWMERVYALTPSEQQSRRRGVARDIYRTVGGYVTGNLLISLIAGTAATIMLLILGVPFAVALGLLVDDGKAPGPPSPQVTAPAS